MRLAIALLAVSAAASAAELEPSAVLPDPPASSLGQVPMSEPVAPVPSGSPPWAVNLSLGAGVADAFYSKVATTVAARRGFGAFSAEVFGTGAVSWADAAFQLCSAPGSCVAPTRAQLGAVPGRLNWIGGAGGVVRGTGGKVSLGGLEAVRFSFEGALGAAAVGYRWTDTEEHQAFAPGIRWGVGTGASLGRSFELRLEMTGLFYRTDIRGSQGWERQLFLGGGFAWIVGAR